MEKKAIKSKNNLSFLKNRKRFAVLGLVFFAVALVIFTAIDPQIYSFKKQLVRQNVKVAPETVLQPAPETVGAAKTNETPVANATSTKADLPKTDTLEIPKLESVLPIVATQSTDTAYLHSLLDEGVVLYPGSAAFGAPGQTVLLGHSAPADWPNIKHDTAFSNIYELAAGDKITVFYDHKTYNYSVVKNEIISKGGDLSGPKLAGNSLVLVTCWPPGRNQMRVAVEAVLDTHF
jgi:LPXTG-site transpeptidase (sortase) family protein